MKLEIIREAVPLQLEELPNVKGKTRNWWLRKITVNGTEEELSELRSSVGYIDRCLVYNSGCHIFAGNHEEPKYLVNEALSMIRYNNQRGATDFGDIWVYNNGHRQWVNGVCCGKARIIVFITQKPSERWSFDLEPFTKIHLTIGRDGNLYVV